MVAPMAGSRYETLLSLDNTLIDLADEEILDPPHTRRLIHKWHGAAALIFFDWYRGGS